MSLLADLRRVNIIRDAEWDTSENGLDASFFANELAGEVGEAIEVVQHMLFGDGPEPPIEALAEELADVVICVDLLALKLGFFVDPDARISGDPIDPVQEAFNLAKFTGRACNIAKKLERERLGLVGSRATLPDLAAELVEVLTSVDRLATEFGIGLDLAVPTKFNKTSDKCGLQTKMALAA